MLTLNSSDETDCSENTPTVDHVEQHNDAGVPSPTAVFLSTAGAQYHTSEGLFKSRNNN